MNICIIDNKGDIVPNEVIKQTVKKNNQTDTYDKYNCFSGGKRKK
jgi:hypothetical protein